MYRVMCEKLISNGPPLHLSWLVTLLVLCVTAEGEDDDLSPNEKILDTTNGQLLICLIILVLLTFVMSVVLCILCRYYCCIGRDVKEPKSVFRDAEEGSVELLALKEEKEGSDGAEDGDEKGDRPAVGDDGVGVESKEETKSDKVEVTLSTFGHTSEEKESGDDKKESENQSGEPTATGDASGSDSARKVVDQKSDTESKEAKEATDVDAKEMNSSDETAKDGIESKQKADANKSVEAAEQAKGQTKAVEGQGPTLQPIPVAPPIIFDLLPPVTKLEPSASGATAKKSKEEIAKDSSVTKVAEEIDAEKKAESKVKDEKTVEEPPKPTVPESKSTDFESNPGATIMGFDDIERALGLALKDLGGDI